MKLKWNIEDVKLILFILRPTGIGQYMKYQLFMQTIFSDSISDM